jgi:hypothetical protein
MVELPRTVPFVRYAGDALIVLDDPLKEDCLHSLVACEHVAMPGEGPYHPEDDEDDRVYCEHGRRADVCTLCPIPRPGSNS